MSSHSNSNSSAGYPPTGERLEPIGTENPAVYIEPRDTVLTEGDLKKNNRSLGRSVGRSPSGAVDVQYSSGMTTIRIAGTPVTKRRQLFEDKTQNTTSLDRPKNLKANVPNSIKNSLIRNNKENKNRPEDSFAISTTIPFTPEINDDDIKPETVITDLNGNDLGVKQGEVQNSKTNEEIEALYSVPMKRKKVSFHNAVVVNEDDRTTLEIGDEEDELNKRSTPNIENSEIVYTDGSMTEIMPQKDFSFMNNGVTPIVDEYELIQLSRRLSSKEKQGLVLPAAPHIQSVDITSNMSDNKSDSSNKSKDSSNKQAAVVSVVKAEKKRSSKSKKTRNNNCLWFSICLIVLLIAALLVLGILYAVRVAEDSDTGVINKLVEELSLVSTQPGDVFSSAMKSVSSNNVVYYLADQGDLMTWQKPGNTTVMSWHRGSILQVVSLPASAGGPLTTQLLGDVATVSDTSFSLILRASNWYAAKVIRGEFVLISVVTTGSGMSWTKSDLNTLKSLHLSHTGVIDEYTDTSVVDR